MTMQWADDQNEGYLASDIDESPPLPEPIRGFETDPPHEHYPEGDPYSLYEQDLYDDPASEPGYASAPEHDATPGHLTVAAIWAGVAAAAVATVGVWLFVRSRRRREHPAKRAARQFSERSLEAAAHRAELAEPYAKRGVATSVEAASRLRGRAETLRRR